MPAIPPPRSREERLREFYASRDPDKLQRADEQPHGETQLSPQGQSGTEWERREVKLHGASKQLQQVQQPAPQRLLATAKKPDPEQVAKSLELRKQGNDAYEAGGFESSVESYTSAIRLAPTAVLYNNRAAAYMQLGWWEQALRDTKAAVRREPTNVKALERHGRVLLALDRPDEALEVAEALERQHMDSANGDAAATLPVGARRLRWLADQARSSSELAEVRAVLAALGAEAEGPSASSPLGLRLRRRLVEALLAEADSLERQRREPSAAAGGQAPQVQELAPLAEEAATLARELLDAAEEAGDETAVQELRYQRARALVRVGRRMEAKAQLAFGPNTALEDLDAASLATTMVALDESKRRGDELFQQERFSDAVRAYTDGIEKDLACIDTYCIATLHHNRSAANRRIGEFEQALRDANTALLLRPGWTKALYRRAVLLLEIGRAAEALDEFKVVQKTDPTFDDDLEKWIRRAHHWLAKPSEEPNYYQLLRLPMDASKDDIKKQFRRLALLWHPDKNPSDAGRQRFEDLREAYMFLTGDEDQKDYYDFGLWKDQDVRHHVARRRGRPAPPRSSPWAPQSNDDGHLDPWGRPVDKHLLEDDKVESIYWGDQGCPEWLRELRKEVEKRRHGDGAEKVA